MIQRAAIIKLQYKPYSLKSGLLMVLSKRYSELVTGYKCNSWYDQASFVTALHKINNPYSDSVLATPTTKC